MKWIGILTLLVLVSGVFAASCTVDSTNVRTVFSETNLPTMDAFRYLLRDGTGDVYQKQTLTTTALGTPSCTVSGNSCTVDMSSVRAVIMPDNQATITVYEYVEGYAPDKILHATISGTPTCQVSGNTCTVDSTGLSVVITPDNTASVAITGETYKSGNTMIFDGSVISKMITGSISGTPTCTVSGNTCSVDTSNMMAVISPYNTPTVTLHFNRVSPKTISATLVGQATCTVSSLPQTCSDGTPAGSCSATKPKECMNGYLLNNATKCGCPVGTKVAAGGIFCESVPCTDGDIIVPEGTCSAKKQKKCVGGVLVNKASECGCPSSMTTTGESCISAPTTPENQSNQTPITPSQTNQTQEPSATNCTVSLELVATTKMKLESMKLNFVKFGDVASSLANYYASVDKSKSASWREIASDLDSTQPEIDGFIETLKNYSVNDCSFKEKVNSNLKSLDVLVSSIYQKIIRA